MVCNRTPHLNEYRGGYWGMESLSSAAVLSWAPNRIGVERIVTAMPAESPRDSWGPMMVASQNGDAAAYRALLGEVAVWLRRYYVRRLPPAAIEDAIQDVLLAVHEKRHTYDPARPFGPWLAAIARYKWIDRLRTLKVQATEPLDETMGVADHGDRVMAGSALRQ